MSDKPVPIEFMTECRITEMMDDLAAKITVEHQEVLKAFNKGVLEHAIKAGELLNEAKERANFYRRKWSDWLAEKYGDDFHRTANVYQQLANHGDLVRNSQHAAKSMGEELSIRGALKLIPKKKRPKAPAKAEETEATKAAEVAKAAEAAKAAVVREPAYGPTLEDILADKEPDEVFEVVKRKWDDDQIKDLMVLLGDYLKERGVPPPTKTPVQIEGRV
jgi:hypothetical protein